VQAIGGVNEKIEGFFRVCAATGLTGSQGVLIPSTNVGDLNLSAEVVEAVAEGQFHVWAVDAIADGVEILTGVRAGRWRNGKGWTPGSVFEKCQNRLDEMVHLMRAAVKGRAGDSEIEANE